MSETSPIWHPMTQHALMGPEIHIDRAEGAYLHANDGRAILDGISSWWVITHGHCHPKIAAAVKEQAEKLEQVIFAGFTHEPAEALAEKLLAMSAEELEYVFFSDSGSTAIEVALKMAVGYFEHTGQTRRTIVALEGGYHGDTFGMMSLGGRSVFNRIYEPYLFDVEHLPFPSVDQEAQCLGRFEDLLKTGDVVALILEPLVQGAAGMRAYTPETLKALSDLCKQYGALLIADEVMTGFSRTGSLFACDQADIAPDLLCLSKGVTGGFLPMGLTLCSADIYQAFYQKDRAKTFFHSTSFTGNPLACRAALANLEIWEEEPVMEKVQAIAQSHESVKARFEDRADVAAVRHLGTIFALDVKDDVHGYLSGVGPAAYEYFLENDVLLRPIGNTIYILPPYCVSAEELGRVYDVIEGVLEHLQQQDNQFLLSSPRRAVAS